jgi:hypothetical protein
MISNDSVCKISANCGVTALNRDLAIDSGLDDRPFRQS